jgi:hypothetical protein
MFRTESGLLQRDRIIKKSFRTQLGNVAIFRYFIINLIDLIILIIIFIV